MTPYKQRSCPITQRLAEDLMIRNMADATIDAYTYHVRRLADFINKPLDRVTPEDVRTFQLHLIQDKNLAYSTFNQAVCALRFYYRHTAPMPWPVTMVPFGKRPKTLPVVLSRNEIEKLFQCTTNLKHQTFMMTLYSGGLRFSEAARLKVADIDGVVYYQVVMTLPSELSELALSNRELLGGLLPKSAWSSLDRSIRREQGYKAAAISVLHTWNQQLMNHWHVHLLVPGAGPSVEGDHWVEATPPTGSRNDHGFYLVDADILRSRFRKTLLRRLAQARGAGKLKLTGRHAYLQDDDNWTAFVNALAAKTWVAYIQPPPTTESQAHHVVNYLTRYLTGGPISDHRIVSANRQSVTFLAREGKQVGGRRTQVPITISTQEFTQRWSEHIQPDHLTKVRYFGGWSNSKVGQYMRRCRDLSSATTAEPDSQNADPQNVDRQQADLICEHCGSDRMVLQSKSPPPSWRELLGYGSSASPPWYAALRDESDRIFWDGLMGEGFNAWYLETLIESAKETELQPSPPLQLHLPGFAPPDPYLLNSF